MISTPTLIIYLLNRYIHVLHVMIFHKDLYNSIFTLLEFLPKSIVPFLYRTVPGASWGVWIQWTDHVQTPPCKLCQELCLDDRWERMKQLGNQDPLVSDCTGWWIICCVLLQILVYSIMNYLLCFVIGPGVYHGEIDVSGTAGPQSVTVNTKLIRSASV